MALAKTLVSLRGGPAAIVRASHDTLNGDTGSASFEGPLHFVEGSGLSPKQREDSPARDVQYASRKKGNLISSGRLLLEILATYEVFSKSRLFIAMFMANSLIRYHDIWGGTYFTQAW